MYDFRLLQKFLIPRTMALMLPYALAITVAWILLFILWFVLGIPLGPGYPVSV